MSTLSRRSLLVQAASGVSLALSSRTHAAPTIVMPAWRRVERILPGTRHVPLAGGGVTVQIG